MLLSFSFAAENNRRNDVRPVGEAHENTGMHSILVSCVEMKNMQAVAVYVLTPLYVPVAMFSLDSSCCTYAYLLFFIILATIQAHLLGAFCVT